MPMTAGTSDLLACSPVGVATNCWCPLRWRTEAAWMIGSRLGAATEAAFVSSIAVGELTLVDLVPEDWSRCAELIVAYSDLDLGLVDASVIAVAERLALTTVATIDRRHFHVVRPRHCVAFELVP